MYADDLSIFPNTSADKDFKRLDIDDLKYKVSLINSFEFEPQNLSSFIFDENRNVNEVKPYINVQILVQSQMQMQLRK